MLRVVPPSTVSFFLITNMFYSAKYIFALFILYERKIKLQLQQYAICIIVNSVELVCIFILFLDAE